MDKINCDKCEETFIKGWSEEDADKEYHSSPWFIPNQDTGILCEDCFEEFKIWFATLTDEDHKKLRGR
jgi:hypothetical protein